MTSPLDLPATISLLGDWGIASNGIASKRDTAKTDDSLVGDK